MAGAGRAGGRSSSARPRRASKCHAVHGLGGLIGPDLTNLIHRDYASVMRDITQPSFAINPDYIPQTITLNDERVLQGVVRTVGDKVHIGDKDGKTTIVEQGRRGERCARRRCRSCRTTS